MKYALGFLKMVSNNCRIVIEAPEGENLQDIDKLCNELHLVSSYEEFISHIGEAGYKILGLSAAPGEFEVIVDELEEIEEETL